MISHLLTPFAFRRLFLPSFHIPLVFSFIAWHFVDLFLLRFTFPWLFHPSLHVPSFIYSGVHFVGFFFLHSTFRRPFLSWLCISLVSYCFISHFVGNFSLPFTQRFFLVLVRLLGPRLPLAHRFTMQG